MSARRRFTATLLVAFAAVLGPTAAGMASQAGQQTGPQTAAAGGSAYGCPSDALGNPIPGDCTEDTHW
ncbi:MULTISPECIES: hypothetical protein [Streptomyces]|jgi:hypothetical protein|uniref:Chitin-binding protein n=1 Tax=Streptomyces radiopugnans TaxID=403935 RepID=A0A1H9C8P0_9ACTN|nr:hypothetical protein [Streptomyces radiopugnans]URN12626.1 hypothetical protein LUW77_16040 [Streptomyces radiopugnans]SEP97635.1 hypothetical protein SAMN05216481_103103 [Streptomyces radiopugnans]